MILVKHFLKTFLYENKNLFKSELFDIISRLKVMGNETGAREDFFKHREGVPGDGVCALYEEPYKHLRLYCIRYADSMIILGGGGEKRKNIKALQEDKKLTKENYLLREISEKILERIKGREIEWSDDYMDLIGELEFNTEEYD